ncbi:AraC family transcriptional regulator [Paraburkholderia hospita]|uniref:AraC family transcriptional regulator n=1 Tax=Paraburkholderia hospita TaxID=169430 RepID=A0AAN1JFY6_9BURK|nr:AraC family transcriptional regulator [Paraburkholderia hospita]OUL95500.1 AraC family transcriptional regulator [Paraburkholderia hospita]SEH52127.1 AraC family transcriptional regulator [Paraburkholderia hospita]
MLAVYWLQALSLCVSFSFRRIHVNTPLIPTTDPAAPPFGLHSVCKTLSDSNATLERFAWLGDQLAVAIWTRETKEAETIYAQPGHHTLSCYLDGGYRTERQKLPGRYGAPSRLCALPGDHESRWWVRGHMHFMHLYFLPEHFTQRAIRELDREPRELTLADRTYFEDEHIATLCQSLANDAWDDADGRLRANETSHEILSLLLRSQGVNRADAVLKGGLAVATRRRLREYIDQNLTQPLTLGELAAVANLSEFHLARMFRASFGLPPHAWIAQQRLERARTLLRTTALPLVDIATQCGYANASHFSHRFRQGVGVSPAAWRQALRAG